jgi:DNA-binding IclR family transcriptional regulator
MGIRYSNNVVSKTFAVLKAFTDQKPEWGVHELARYLEIPTSSLHRILKTLRDEDLLKISPETGKYSIGPEMIRFASIISSEVDIKKVAKPFMKELSSQLQESIYLTQYHSSHKKLSFIEVVHGPNALQYVIEIGALQPITIAASGKAILAFLDSNEMEAAFKVENISGEEREELLKELQIIRNQGYSLTANQRKLGALSIGVPIFDASQKVIGSIIYTVPANRFDKSKKDMITNTVMEEVGKLSHTLGYKGSTMNHYGGGTI